MTAETYASILSQLTSRANCLPPDHILQAPKEPGVYAWWSTNAQLLGLEGVPVGDLWLYYIGKTGSRKGLRGRLSTHRKGPVRSSTLRRTLIALQATPAQPGLTPQGKLKLTRPEEAALQAWIDSHLLVSWASTSEFGEVEDTLISTLKPPLNVKGNRASPHSAQVAGARRASLDAAVGRASRTPSPGSGGG